MVVGGLDIKPIKTEDTGQQDDEELQDAVEDVATQEMPNYIVGLHCNLTHFISCNVGKFNILLYWLLFCCALGTGITTSSTETP